MLAEFIGGEVNVSGDYPAWEYVNESDIRDTISDVYRELFDEEPVFEAIHAGLECGIISGKIDNLDCVSFGPDNFDIHTPNERLTAMGALSDKGGALLRRYRDGSGGECSVTAAWALVE